MKLNNDYERSINDINNNNNNNDYKSNVKSINHVRQYSKNIKMTLVVILMIY